ncbi:GNAT family N-acetyltransferase [Bacillus benzoevorans]|uniref:GNAT superfamily N-acetyltransferase n=1 Tax=Bacillus benzoevorans TaxID=1456 RepID=A0A7X0HR68_9BACI|nr:GNAT family N-acetyltransferase [Bacillus benzoevorans]MBB6444125.1 GNAT superfamily N-acetyltransferase [Bacillus benzoevorans]
MIIRQATIDEMFALWYKFYTSDFFADNIQRGNAEFWAMEYHARLIGELYIFKELHDRDFADGATTAYLYGFRIEELMRGKGLGTMLMDRVLHRLKALNFKYVTVGVELEHEENIRLYKRMGFTETIKTVTENPCDVDENFIPTYGPAYLLLRKAL